MKKRKGAALLAVVLLALMGAGAVTLARGQGDALQPGEPGGGSIAGARCVWSGDERGTIGVFDADGTLCLSWVDTSWGRRAVCTIGVPASVLEQYPAWENDPFSLVDHAKELGQKVSTVDIPKRAAVSSADPLEKNAARLRVEELLGEGAYEQRSIYSPDGCTALEIQVLETRTLEARPVGDRDGWLRKGWPASAVLAALEAAGLSGEQAAAYGNEALPFVDGALATEISVREYEVEVRYTRTGGYRPMEGGPLPMAEGIREERSELYRVWMTCPEGTGTADFADLAHLVSGPAEADIPESFSVQSIVRRVAEQMASGGGK